MTAETRRKQPGTARAVAEIGGGIALVVLGSIASFIPVIPGWLFVIPGLVLLACWVRPIRAMVSWVLERALILRLFSAVADNDRTRRVVSRLMSSSPARRAIDRAVRWELLHAMLARRAAGDDETWVEPHEPLDRPSADDIGHEPVLGLR